MPERKLLTQKIFFYSLMVLTTLSALTLFGNGMLAYSERPQFCNKCHVMMPQYSDWQNSNHSPVKCTECHAPNKLSDKLIFKAKTGLKDLYLVTTGKVPDMIHTTQESKAIIFRNCIRCHENTLVSYHIPVNTYCWNCHQIK